MAASSSKAVFGDAHIDDMIATCGNGLEFSKPSAVFFSDRSRSSCLKSSVKMRNRELPNSRLVCGNFMLDAMRGNGKANNLVVGTLLKNLYSSSSVCSLLGLLKMCHLMGILARNRWWTPLWYLASTCSYLLFVSIIFLLC
jgi:protein phosphatase PTC7